MRLRALIILFSFSMVGCATSIPTGKVVSAIGSDTFHVQYSQPDLKAGDKIKIMEMKATNLGETFEFKKELVGTGKVSKELSNNFYEIKTDTNLHIGSDAFIEKI